MTKQVIFQKTRTTRKLYKRIPTADGRGFTTELNGEEEVFYSTSIDLEVLHQMGRQAAHNTSGKSRDGALEVKVIERRRLP